MSNLNLEDSCEMSIKREHSPITEIVARPFHNSANHVDETLNSVRTEPEPEEGSHHPEIKQEPDIKREPELKQEEQSEEAEVASAIAETVWIVIKSSNLHLGQLFASCQVMGVFRTVELANVAARSFAQHFLSHRAAMHFAQPDVIVRHHGGACIQLGEPETGKLTGIIEVRAISMNQFFLDVIVVPSVSQENGSLRRWHQVRES